MSHLGHRSDQTVFCTFPFANTFKFMITHEFDSFNLGISDMTE